jgi:hypothetical protein
VTAARRETRNDNPSVVREVCPRQVTPDCSKRTFAELPAKTTWKLGSDRLVFGTCFPWESYPTKSLLEAFQGGYLPSSPYFQALG